MFCYVSLEARTPREHPLRAIRKRVDEALRAIRPELDRLYARRMDRPSIPPERLLRALLLQVLYTVRSERQLMEQLDYNLLFRWFVGLDLEDAVWDATVFTKNRQRLLAGSIARKFFTAVVEQADREGLLSNEHFSVDGTLVEAWASHKSLRPREQPEPDERDPDDPGNPTVNWRGEKRSNETHRSTTDPEARLARMKGKEAKLAYQGHVLADNRHGLVVDARLTQASGSAKREAALEMARRIPTRRRVTLGADRGYDAASFVAQLRALPVTPHVAQNQTRRRSAIDGRTTRHAGYAWSQRVRKRVEEVFGWMKTIGLMRKTRHRGAARVGWSFVFAAAAYNLVRMRTLLAAA
jgi:transposase